MEKLPPRLLIQELLTSRFEGKLFPGKHRPGSTVCCALELLSVHRGIPWTDSPSAVRCFDLRPLNDIPVGPVTRAGLMLPVLVAYDGSRDWEPERQRAVAERLVILTVNRLIGDLPGLPADIREACRAARDVPEAEAAAKAAQQALEISKVAQQALGISKAAVMSRAAGAAGAAIGAAVLAARAPGAASAAVWAATGAAEAAEAARAARAAREARWELWEEEVELANAFEKACRLWLDALDE